MSLPTAPSRTMDQDTFDATTDAFVGALSQFETDMNALAAAMTLNATTDTSTSSVLIGTGSKTFTVTAGKSFWPGMWLVIADTAAPTTNAMYAQVSSYSGTTLIVNSVSVQGSGTLASWQISQTVRADGAVFSGPVLFNTVADIASAATINLTSYGSGFIATVTGTTPISALTMSDGQFGTLKAAAALPFTNTTTTCETYGGADITAYAGQLFDVSKTGGVVTVVPRNMGLVGPFTVATTSGTAIDLSGIPAHAKRILAVPSGISTNGTSDITLQLATGGTFKTSGYTSGISSIDGTNATTATSPTTAIVLKSAVAAASLYSGRCELLKVSSGNYVHTSQVHSHTGISTFGNGTTALGGDLSDIRLSAGGDTFDAGSVSLYWE